jgi:Transposase IS66 family
VQFRRPTHPTVPVLAKMKTITGRLWAYVRDDRPFGGKDPPAAFFQYSRSRAGEYPRTHLAGWVGIMQADAFAGFNELYAGTRQPAPITEAACWAHYLESDFMWSGVATPQFWPMTSGRRTPHKSASAGHFADARESVIADPAANIDERRHVHQEP